MMEAKTSLRKLLISGLDVKVGDEVRIEYNIHGVDYDEMVRVIDIVDDAIYFEAVTEDA